MTDEKRLVQFAMQAKENSYAPYSNFHVGAALLAKDGQIYTGCNVENASYSATNCAERTAFYKALSEGVKDFLSIAIVSDSDTYVSPCGVCRQVMVEFCQPEFLILMCDRDGNYKKIILAELMPESFNCDIIK